MEILQRLNRRVIVLVVIALLALVLLPKLSFFYSVKYGEVAVVSQFGKLVRVSEPGLHFKMPLFESVDYYSTQKIIYETSESTGTSLADYKDTPVDSSTQDGQQLNIRYTTRFRIRSEQVKWVAENLGREDQVVERIIKAETRSVVRNVAREFQAQDLYTGNVFQFQDRISQILKERFTANGLELDEFLVRQVEFSPEYVTAVEQKQIEKEKVKTEEFKAEQEQFKKAQLITRAEGEAKAQEVLKQSLDPLLLQKLAIEKWNGILPQYFGGNSALPFLNIK